MSKASLMRVFRFRFSLRSAMLLMTCIAALLAYHIWYSQIRREAVAAVTDAGGNVEAVETILPDWLIDLIGREYFSRIETVDGYYRKLSDDHLTAISNLAETRHIQTNHLLLGMVMGTASIASSGIMGDKPLITDKGLAQVSRIRKLESLVLFNTAVTDEGIAQLTGLKKIQYLKISSLGITDASILQLSKLKSLKQIWTSGTSITPGGVERLRKALPNCEVISATGDDAPFYDL